MESRAKEISMPKRKVFRKVVTLSKVVERREKIDIESLLDAGFDGDADECQEEVDASVLNTDSCLQMCVELQVARLEYPDIKPKNKSVVVLYMCDETSQKDPNLLKS